MSKGRVNEWACKRSCSSDDLGDLVQQHAPLTMAYVWQRNNRDRSCVKSLFGNIYCITQNNQTTYVQPTRYSALYVLGGMSFHTWILSTKLLTIQYTSGTTIYLVSCIPLLALKWTSYWSLLDLSRIQHLNISYVHSVLFSNDKWRLLTGIPIRPLVTITRYMLGFPDKANDTTSRCDNAYV